MNPSDVSYTDSFVIIFAAICAISVTYGHMPTHFGPKTRERTRWIDERTLEWRSISTIEPEDPTNGPGFREGNRADRLSQLEVGMDVFAMVCRCLPSARPSRVRLVPHGTGSIYRASPSFG